MSNIYNVISVSFGKDSTCMLIDIIEKGEIIIDEVIFFDTGAEFSEIYSVKDYIYNTYLKPLNIKFTVLKGDIDLITSMKNHKSWCRFDNRFYTNTKITTIDNYLKKYNDMGYEVYQYLGIALDEYKRVIRLPFHKVPYLYFHHITEKQALEFCYNHGINFGGLYDYLDRVSCWCCGNKNVKELANLYVHNPRIFNKLKELENICGNYRNYGNLDYIIDYAKSKGYVNG